MSIYDEAAALRRRIAELERELGEMRVDRPEVRCYDANPKARTEMCLRVAEATFDWLYSLGDDVDHKTKEELPALVARVLERRP